MRRRCRTRSLAGRAWLSLQAFDRGQHRPRARRGAARSDGRGKLRHGLPRARDPSREFARVRGEAAEPSPRPRPGGRGDPEEGDRGLGRLHHRILPRPRRDLSSTRLFRSLPRAPQALPRMAEAPEAGRNQGGHAAQPALPSSFALHPGLLALWRRVLPLRHQGRSHQSGAGRNLHHLRNASYDALRAAGSLLVTGPTGGNVCDIQVLLVRR